jgi:hypothetical protein
MIQNEACYLYDLRYNRQLNLMVGTNVSKELQAVCVSESINVHDMTTAETIVRAPYCALQILLGR